MGLIFWIIAILFAVWVLWMIVKPRRPSYSSDGIEVIGGILDVVADILD
jgi:hypothetical protein